MGQIGKKYVWRLLSRSLVGLKHLLESRKTIFRFRVGCLSHVSVWLMWVLVRVFRSWRQQPSQRSANKESKMANILVVGAGDIGGTLPGRLVENGHQVWGLRRTEQNDDTGIQWLQADVTDIDTLVGLPDKLDVVVYSVASPVFSRDGYHEYYYRGLKHVLKVLKGRAPLRLLFVSSSSVYHQMQGEWVD